MSEADVGSEQIRTFLALHRTGSVTGAAAELHLSQPATSRRVALLEQAVGGALFERVPAGVVLTEAGHAFLPHAEAVVAAQRDGVAAVAEVVAGRAGTLTLALVGTLADRELGRTLQAFRSERPGVDLRLRTAISADVSDLVRRGDASLGLRYGPDPALDGDVLYDEQLVAICASDHPLAGTRATGPDLAGERWLTFPPRPGDAREAHRDAVDEHLRRNGLADVDVVAIDSLTAQIRLVEAGFGLALVPAGTVHGELRHGALRTLELPVAGPAVPVVLVRRQGAFAGAATRALAEALLRATV